MDSVHCTVQLIPQCSQKITRKSQKCDHIWQKCNFASFSQFFTYLPSAKQPATTQAFQRPAVGKVTVHYIIKIISIDQAIEEQ